MTTRREFFALSGIALAASALPTLAQEATGKSTGSLNVTQVRNATLIVNYAGVRFLVDPYLAEKEAYPGFEGTFNEQLRNPRVALQTPMEDILNVDAVIVTHTHHGNPHGDHWDEAAARLVPKHLPLFAQDEQDAQIIRSQGFKDVRVLTKDTVFNGVTLSRTSGRHGSEAALKLMPGPIGEVCGVVFRHPNEKTLYIAGDTLWNAFVKTAIATYQPDVIVLNAGFAIVPGLGGIIMGCEDVKQVYDAAPNATLVASHLEAVNHASVTRADLRAFANDIGMSDRLLIPADGETISL